MTSKKRLVLGIFAIAIVAIFLLWPADQPAQTAQKQSKPYPATWKHLGLADVPGAEVTDVTGSNLEDGVEFEFEVNMPANEMGSYFEEKLEERDFDYYEPSESSEQEYSNEFTKGDIGISIDIGPSANADGRSRVRVAIDRERRANVHTNNVSLQID